MEPTNAGLKLATQENDPKLLKFLIESNQEVKYEGKFDYPLAIATKK